jgi:hypothetical protein
MAIDLNTPRYTKDQMVGAAVAQGHRASDRLLTDWQAAGLLDQPTKRGLGRGKGIEALWPESQLRLWLILLEKRVTITQVPVLCNVPVGLWLYFGDEYAPLRQVRKCMKTWSFRYGSSRGHQQAKQAARALLADVTLQASRNSKAALISAMAKALLHGISNDEERRRLRASLLSSVIAAGQVETVATAKVDLVLSRLLGARHLVQSDVPDHVLVWARVAHLFGLRQYMAALREGTLPNLPGVDNAAPDFEKLIQNACLHLVSSVGMALSLSTEERLPAPLFHPDLWKEGWTSVDLKWQVESPPILMPNGGQQVRYHVQVSGQIQLDSPTASLPQ